MQKNIIAKVVSLDKLDFLQSYQGKRVYVGLSGGVDSAVAAALLKAYGAIVVGVYMKNWAGEQGLQLDCPWEEELASAKSVADYLQIEFASFNFEKQYKEDVLDYFFREYEAGRTPNPDILCNSEIKFKAFLNKSFAEGANAIATGHYAGKRIVGSVGERNLASPLEMLVKGVDQNKDQSYFLSALDSQQLSRALFPLMNLTKPQVRNLAAALGLPNAQKPDSQGICFIGDLDVNAFLHKHISNKPGDIIDVDTLAVVGKHDGLSFYTIGQREGLRIGGSGEPYYVCKKDAAENKLFVARGSGNPALYSEVVHFSNLHWINTELNAELNTTEVDLTAMIRYRQKPQSGRLMLEQGATKGKFVFNEKQRAITPGQSIVFYFGDVCLGRAVID